jgi:molybdopterin synthase catalytic subunit
MKAYADDAGAAAAKYGKGRLNLTATAKSVVGDSMATVLGCSSKNLVWLLDAGKGEGVVLAEFSQSKANSEALKEGQPVSFEGFVKLVAAGPSLVLTECDTERSYTVRELFRLCIADESGARRLYDEKRLQVVGTVVMTARESVGAVVVLYPWETNKYKEQAITATFNSEKAATLQAGTVITFAGTVDRISSDDKADVLMFRACELL